MGDALRQGTLFRVGVACSPNPRGRGREGGSEGMGQHWLPRVHMGLLSRGMEKLQQRRPEVGGNVPLAGHANMEEATGTEGIR